MLALSKGQLEGASLQSIVETAVRHHFGEGYGPWSQAETVKYMSAQRRKTVGGFVGETLGEYAVLILGVAAAVCVATLAVILGRYVVTWSGAYWCLATPASLALVVCSWHGIYKLFDGTYWQTNGLRVDGTYPRDYKNVPIPPEIKGLHSTVTGMLDHPSFEVSFIGRDPILWVVHNGMRVPAVIWDELRDGSITLVPLPRR